MTNLQAIILGAVQGLTEFLPVSSSGHLVIVPYLFGWELPESSIFIFDVLVQVASMVAVLGYFWDDLWIISKSMIQGVLDKKPAGTEKARLGWMIVIASIPAGIIGILAKGIIEKSFSSPLIAGVLLLFTALLLVVAETIGKRLRLIYDLRVTDSIYIGLFQVLALFPGVSRSGATMSGGMTRDLTRETSARFSFLMSVPIMLAAGILALFDLAKLPELATLLPVFLPGFLTSAIVGYLAIRWLLQYLINHTFYIFAIYCTALGIIVIITTLV
jgi:undecaprenyl-diphosphatase